MKPEQTLATIEKNENSKTQLEPLILEAILKHGYEPSGTSLETYAGRVSKTIAAHLVEKGYGKGEVNENLLSAIVNFRHGLGSLQEDLRAIVRKTDLLTLSDDKCTQLLNIINHHLRPR